MVRRVLITGSRDWPAPELITYTLSGEYQRARGGGLIVVHGAAPRGADLYASRWVRDIRGVDPSAVTEEAHPAKWRSYGIYNPQAGFQRNQRMVDLGADACYAFLHRGSPGTSDCIARAKAAGIRVVIISVD